MINTTLCYIQKQDKYLMLHRTKKQNDLNKDKWIGIGGKFENCESPQDCIRREVLEETGLSLKSEKYCGIVTFVDLSGTDFFIKDGKIEKSQNQKNKNALPFTEYMHLFWSDDFTGTEKICDEGDLEWVPVSKMNDLPHWQGDEIFLDLIARKVPFFSLKLVYKDSKLVFWTLN